MADNLDSVKSLASNYRDWSAASTTEGKLNMAARQSRNATMLEAVAAELEELRRITKPIPSSYGDLSDLPPELMKELTGIKVDDLEQQLYTIVKAGEGEVQLDSVLIELFRRFKIVQTRKFLQNKLWRMAQKGVIYSVPGRKGVYLAEEPKAPPPRPRPSAFDADLDDDVPF